MSKKYLYHLTKFKNALSFLGKSDLIFNKKIQEQKKNVNLRCLYSQTLFNGLHKV